MKTRCQRECGIQSHWKLKTVPPWDEMYICELTSSVDILWMFFGLIFAPHYELWIMRKMLTRIEENNISNAHNSTGGECRYLVFNLFKLLRPFFVIECNWILQNIFFYSAVIWLRLPTERRFELKVETERNHRDNYFDLFSNENGFQEENQQVPPTYH